MVRVFWKVDEVDEAADEDEEVETELVEGDELELCVKEVEALEEKVVDGNVVLAVDEDDVELCKVVELLEEESKAYPPTPAATTITTMAITTATLLLIARVFLRIKPYYTRSIIQTGNHQLFREFCMN